MAEADKVEGAGETGRPAVELSPAELEDSAVATDQLREASETAVERLSDDGPSWPDESAETAFLSEQHGQNAAISLSVTAPAASADDRDREDATIPLPSLDDLINRVPAHTREVLEDLFRARFVRVVRTKKQVLK